MKTYTEKEVAKMVERTIKSLIAYPFECSATLLDYELTSIFGHDIAKHWENAPWLAKACREEEESFEEEDA